MGTGNLGVRLSPESGQFSQNLVFTFSTEDGSAVGEYIRMWWLHSVATTRHLLCSYVSLLFSLMCKYYDSTSVVEVKIMNFMTLA